MLCSITLFLFLLCCRQLTSEGVINWDMLSSGSFSSTISRQVSSSAAGKSGFSFGLEVSGMMLKRSNLEFFFDSPINDDTSRRTKLIQVRLHLIRSYPSYGIRLFIRYGK